MTIQMRTTKPVLLVFLAAAVFLVSVIGSAVATKFGMLEPGVARRIGMIAIGLVLVVAGNFAPKMRLFGHQGFPASRALAARRLSGWALVMAGLAIVGVWLLSASRETILASSLIGLGAFALTGAAWAWLLTGPREMLASQKDVSPAASAAQSAFVWILFALFWSFATFLAAYVWGDDAAMWMTIAFAVGLAIVPAACMKRSSTR